MWNLGMGDFVLDNYAETLMTSDLALIWLVFFGATFMINIVFINMLIAIMSDTFDKVTDIGRDSIELQQKIQILADYIFAIRMVRRVLALVSRLTEDVPLVQTLPRLRLLQ